MASEFVALYTDAMGSIGTVLVLSDNGSKLQVRLRGRSFTGYSVSHLSSTETDSRLVEIGFSVSGGELHKFTLSLSIPNSIWGPSGSEPGLLRAAIRVGNKDVWGTDPDSEDRLDLTLNYHGEIVGDGEDYLGFEDKLASILRKLPTGTSIRCCRACQFSDYNPFQGTALMGELACFVNSASEFRDTTNRGKGFKGWGPGDETRRIQYDLVQEFFVCPNFIAREAV